MCDSERTVGGNGKEFFSLWEEEAVALRLRSFLPEGMTLCFCASFGSGF